MYATWIVPGFPVSMVTEVTGSVTLYSLHLFLFFLLQEDEEEEGGRSNTTDWSPISCQGSRERELCYLPLPTMLWQLRVLWTEEFPAHRPWPRRAPQLKKSLCWITLLWTIRETPAIKGKQAGNVSSTDSHQISWLVYFSQSRFFVLLLGQGPWWEG